MSKEGKLWRAASDLVRVTRNVIMSTADDKGMPHAAWMTVMVNGDMNEVITITAPNTQKIVNLRVNPHAEWMFASPTLETMVYLSGPTEIVAEEAAQSYWDAMSGKSKAYYQLYSSDDDSNKFAIIRTQVTKVVYCRPPGYHKTIVHEIGPKD